MPARTCRTDGLGLSLNLQSYIFNTDGLSLPILNPQSYILNTDGLGFSILDLQSYILDGYMLYCLTSNPTLL